MFFLSSTLQLLIIIGVVSGIFRRTLHLLQLHRPRMARRTWQMQRQLTITLALQVSGSVYG